MSRDDYFFIAMIIFLVMAALGLIIGFEIQHDRLPTGR